MPTSYDPNAPLLDPDIQAALEQGRQAQLAALLRNQQQSSAPRNLGEGIDALGKGLMQGLSNYMAAKNLTANNAAMATALSGAQPMPFLGGASTMTPMTMPPAAAASPAPAMTPPANTASEDINVNQFMAGLKKAEGVPYGGLSSTGAIGAYGLTGGFIKDWGSKLDLPTDRASYINNPGLQDRLASGAAQAMHDKYGNWGDVAQTWEAGGPHTQPAPGNTNPAKYRATVLGTAANANPGVVAPPASPDEVSANIGPASHAVPAGLVAGPGVPNNLPSPIGATHPGYRNNLGTGIGGSQGPVVASAAPPSPPPPPPDEEEEAPAAPLAGAVPPNMLSPHPIGAPQRLIPPGGAPMVPGAAAAVNPGTVPPAVASVPPSGTAGGIPRQSYTPGGAAPPGTHWAHLPGPPLLLAGDENGAAPPRQNSSGVGNLLSQLFGGQAQAQPIRAPAQMAAGLVNQPQTSGPMLAGAPGGPPVNQAPGGLAAGLAGQTQSQPQPQPQAGNLSGNQTVYKQMYDAAAGPAARLQHAAALAAAAGNQALAQEYERQAAPYAAEMNKANELAVAERTEKPMLFTRNDGSTYLGDPRTGQPIAQISPAKPLDRPLTDQEAASFGIKDKAGYAWNPATGKPEQIPGTEAGTTPPTDEDIKNYPFLGAPENKGLFGMDKTSSPKYVGPSEALLNSRQKTANETLTGADGKPIDPNARGPEILGQLPPQVANKAQALIEAREPYPTGPQLRDPVIKQALMAAEQADPGFNAQTYHTRQQMQNSAMAGNGKINVANLANNTALNHSSVVADALAQLDNGESPLKNAAINQGSMMAGGIIPGANTKAAAYANAKVAKEALANEAERSFHGTGAVAEGAVQRAIENIDLNASPQTQMAQLQALQNLLAGKIQANEEDYKQTMGPQVISRWEQQQGRPFSFITPESQASADKVAAMAANIKAGKGWGVSPTAPAPTAAAPVAVAPAAGAVAPRNVAPQITGAPVNATTPPRVRIYNPATGKIE